MIRLICKIPKNITVAFSGGVDSVACVDFLSRKHNITCLHFNHNTEHSNHANSFVREFCKNRNLSLVVGELSREKPKSKSLEEHWRHERYKFFKSNSNGFVITCHHLDDAVETYLFNSFHGNMETIPVINKYIMRPFLTTRKSELVNWCMKNNLSWVEDPSNSDTKYMRNLIRKEIVPLVTKVNRGIYSTVSKIILQSIDKQIDI